MYILVVMLFLGFTVGEAEEYLNVYNTSRVLAGGPRINIPVFWSGTNDPGIYSYSITKSDGSVVTQGSGGEAGAALDFAILYQPPKNYVGTLTLTITYRWSASGKTTSRTFQYKQ